jgi:hypothetical protein
MLSHSIVEVVDALRATLIVGSGGTYTFPDDASGNPTVYYGFTEQLPIFPAITLENAIKTRIDDRTRRWTIAFNVDIVIHYGKVQGGQKNEREENVIAENVEDYLNLNDLGGLLLTAKINRSDPAINRTIMTRVRRLLWYGLSYETF